MVSEKGKTYHRLVCKLGENFWILFLWRFRESVEEVTGSTGAIRTFPDILLINKAFALRPTKTSGDLIRKGACRVRHLDAMQLTDHTTSPRIRVD